VWMGTLVGLAGAVAVGLFFFQGTLKIPLGRFFAVTSWILVIVAVQLAVTGVHELSEAGWLPARVLARGDLATPVTGPAVIEEYDATCVVPPGARASLDAWGNVVIELTR